jgi:replication factor C small subunit
MKKKDFLWVEKYRPQTIEDCILPESTKESFRGFLDKGEIPHLMLCGSAGVGKTTVARALCEELGATVMEINGSDEGRLIDTLRSKITQFATTVDLMNHAKHKVVIIDEADNTSETVQMSLRHAMEKFSGNCRFILTCNFPNRIMEPIHSRCAVVNFAIGNDEKQKLQAQFFSRLEEILKEKEIEYKRDILARVVHRYYPDWRRLIGEVQRFTATGTLLPSVLSEIGNVEVTALVKAMKDKDFSTCRRWVVDNISNDVSIVFRKMYETMSQDTVMKKKSIPSLVLAIAKYSRDIETVPDQEINMLACLTEIMYDCEFQ